jgi:putative membrane protein
MISAVVSALHVLAVGLGLPAVYLRGRALKAPLDDAGFARLFAADTVWGLAAMLFLATGPLRAFAGLEKGTQFYVTSALFWAKLALFALVFVLEIGPMLTFMRWRRQLRGGGRPDTSTARTLYIVTHVEMALVVMIVFVAAFMARGFGHR